MPLSGKDLEKIFVVKQAYMIEFLKIVSSPHQFADYWFILYVVVLRCL